MPLIIITGVPSSGKTTRVNELKHYFQESNREIHIVSEYEQTIKAGFDKNSLYQGSYHIL